MNLLKKDLIAVLAFFALSAGVYYSGAKFHVPWFGANDFSQYYQMTLNPTDNSTLSPWAYRVFVPAIAHFVYKSGLFYETNLSPYKEYYVSYGGVDYDPSVLSALIFTNYVLIAFAAFFLYKSVRLLFSKLKPHDEVTPLILPSLIFLSLSTVVHGYGGLTDGGGLFFVSTLSYLYLKNNFTVFSIVCFFSILCRELVPLILIVYIFFSSADVKRFKFLASAGLSFISYFILRFYIQTPGNENQTSYSSLIEHITTFEITKEFFMQVVLASNITIFAVLLVISDSWKNIKYLLPYFFTVLVLSVLGIATGIGNNVGRIANLALPLLIIGLANWKCLVKSNSPKDSATITLHQ